MQGMNIASPALDRLVYGPCKACIWKVWLHIGLHVATGGFSLRTHVTN